MRLVKPTFHILNRSEFESQLDNIEQAGRTCYQSEQSVTKAGRDEFIGRLHDSGHLSVLEHSKLSVEIICDRGVTHEVVRHRLSAFAQESQRYCNYTKGKYGSQVSFIDPFFFDPREETRPVTLPNIFSIPVHEENEHRLDLSAYQFNMNSFDVWMLSCLMAEWAYSTLIEKFGRTAQEARAVLPNSTKTSIVVTANFRQWLHILSLRACDATGAAHPQMKQIMVPLLAELQEEIPAVFGKLKIPEHNRKYLEM